MATYIRWTMAVLVVLLPFEGMTRAEDAPVVVLSTIGSSFEVRLNGMTEGLTVRSKFRLRNDSGKAFKGLLVKTSCGCLRPMGIDGIDVNIGSEHELEFSFVPTAGSYQQVCTITGNDESDVRKDLITLSFKGNVNTPVTLDRSSVSPTEVEQGSFTTGIKSVADVEIDFTGIQSSESWLSVSGDSKASTLRLSWDMKPASSKASLSVPLKWRGNSYRFNIVIDFVEELVTVVPSQIFFRGREGEKFVVARAILHAHGAELIPETIVICSAVDHTAVTVEGKNVELSIRAINRNRVLVEWRLGFEQVDRFRDKQIVFKAGEVFTSPLPCLFQEKGKVQ